MDITPRELRDVEIRESFRGYHRDDVNELLERAAATLDAANERMQQMNERLATVQSETGHTRETEDILHRTLLLAQRAADEAVGEATAKARQMLDDAEIQSRRLVADAEADAAPARRDGAPPPRRRGPRSRRPARRAPRRRRGAHALRSRLPRSHGSRARGRPLRIAQPPARVAGPPPRDERSRSPGVGGRVRATRARAARRDRHAAGAHARSLRGASVGAGTVAVLSHTGPDREPGRDFLRRRSRPRRSALRASPTARRAKDRRKRSTCSRCSTRGDGELVARVREAGRGHRGGDATPGGRSVRAEAVERDHAARRQSRYRSDRRERAERELGAVRRHRRRGARRRRVLRDAA